MTTVSLLDKLGEIPFDDRPAVVDAVWSHLIEEFDHSAITRIKGLLQCWSGERLIDLRPGQEASDDLFMPDLDDDLPWLGADSFSIAREMEANFLALRTEFDQLQMDGVVLRPYGQSANGSESMEPLPGNPDGWNEFALIENFALNRLNSVQAPVAARLAEMALEIHGVVAQFTYLVLEPGASLEMHTDPANFLVSCHLGIRVPQNCSLTVLDDRRTWVEGKCVAFNNSYRHSAENRSTERRVILTMHALHPSLNPIEGRAIACMIEIFGSLL